MGLFKHKSKDNKSKNVGDEKPGYTILNDDQSKLSSERSALSDPDRAGLTQEELRQHEAQVGEKIDEAGLSKGEGHVKRVTNPVTGSTVEVPSVQKDQGYGKDTTTHGHQTPGYGSSGTATGAAIGGVGTGAAIGASGSQSQKHGHTTESSKLGSGHGDEKSSSKSDPEPYSSNYTKSKPLGTSSKYSNEPASDSKYKETEHGTSSGYGGDSSGYGAASGYRGAESGYSGATSRNASSYKSQDPTAKQRNVSHQTEADNSLSSGVLAGVAGAAGAAGALVGKALGVGQTGSNDTETNQSGTHVAGGSGYGSGTGNDQTYGQNKSLEYGLKPYGDHGAGYGSSQPELGKKLDSQLDPLVNAKQAETGQTFGANRTDYSSQGKYYQDLAPVKGQAPDQFGSSKTTDLYGSSSKQHSPTTHTKSSNTKSNLGKAGAGGAVAGGVLGGLTGSHHTDSHSHHNYKTIDPSALGNQKPGLDYETIDPTGSSKGLSGDSYGDHHHGHHNQSHDITSGTVYDKTYDTKTRHDTLGTGTAVSKGSTGHHGNASATHSKSGYNASNARSDATAAAAAATTKAESPKPKKESHGLLSLLKGNKDTSKETTSPAHAKGSRVPEAKETSKGLNIQTGAAGVAGGAGLSAAGVAALGRGTGHRIESLDAGDLKASKGMGGPGHVAGGASDFSKPISSGTAYNKTEPVNASAASGSKSKSTTATGENFSDAKDYHDSGLKTHDSKSKSHHGAGAALGAAGVAGAGAAGVTGNQGPGYGNDAAKPDTSAATSSTSSSDSKNSKGLVETVMSAVFGDKSENDKSETSHGATGTTAAPTESSNIPGTPIAVGAGGSVGARGGAAAAGVTGTGATSSHGASNVPGTPVATGTPGTTGAIPSENKTSGSKAAGAGIAGAAAGVGGAGATGNIPGTPAAAKSGTTGGAKRDISTGSGATSGQHTADYPESPTDTTLKGPAAGGYTYLKGNEGYTGTHGTHGSHGSHGTLGVSAIPKGMIPVGDQVEPKPGEELWQDTATGQKYIRRAV